MTNIPPTNQPTQNQAECRRFVLGSHFGMAERVPCHLGCDVCQRRQLGLTKDDPVDYARWADDFRRQGGLGGGGGGGGSMLGSKRPVASAGGGAAAATAAAAKQARTDDGGGWLGRLGRGAGASGGNGKKGFAASAAASGVFAAAGRADGNDENAREIEVLSLSA